jgi:hypothetical protein
MGFQMITDRHALTVEVEYVIDANGTKTILLVETDLQLDPAEVDFDKAAVDALCTDLERHRTSNPYIDAVRLIRRRPGRADPLKITGTFGERQFVTTPSSIQPA